MEFQFRPPLKELAHSQAREFLLGGSNACRIGRAVFHLFDPLLFDRVDVSR